MMQQAQGGEYITEKDVEAYVQEVGQKLAAVSDRPNLPYEFVVLNNSVPNAWSLPGGKIAIYRGLLLELNSEAELAAVLAHEIVHSAARHGAQAMERGVLMSAGLIGLSQILKGHKYEEVAMGTASLGANLGTLKYSRIAELQADKYGIKYMVAAGYDPEAAVDLQRLFLKLSEGKRANWFSTLFATHPPSEERLKANETSVTEYPAGGKIGKEEYQEAMAPLKKAKPAYENLDKGYKDLLAKNPKGALLYAQEGLEIEPNEAHLYNLKGKAEFALRNYQDALDAFNQAIELNNNYFDFYLQRGLVLKKLGDNNEAKDDLARSIALLPSAEAEYGLGQIDLMEGNRASAIYHFQNAAQVDAPIGARSRQRLAEMSIPGE